MTQSPDLSLHPLSLLVAISLLPMVVGLLYYFIDIAINNNVKRHIQLEIQWYLPSCVAMETRNLAQCLARGNCCAVLSPSVVSNSL